MKTCYLLYMNIKNKMNNNIIACIVKPYYNEILHETNHFKDVEMKKTNFILTYNFNSEGLWCTLNTLAPANV